MLKRLLLVGLLLAVPTAARAQMQLRFLQQQQVWRLQEQERQTRAQQDERLQQELLQEQANLPPLPDLRLGQPSDEVGRRSFAAWLQAEQLELMRRQDREWRRIKASLLAQLDTSQDRMRDLQQTQQLQLEQQQQQLQMIQRQQQQQMLQQHLLQQQQQFNQFQQQSPGSGR